MRIRDDFLCIQIFGVLSGKEHLHYIFVVSICSWVVFNEFGLRTHTTEYNKFWEIIKYFYINVDKFM